ncbi:unnamed protein product [Vitrella brassicaformis CCMP3155]|uniref:Plastocyanin-like domain-containing protein n=3 Tax=Vitrella brassicaformis TaxID=1169539 RepID=A0A0G4GG83_VITBC|nr:unnamed protein product [Vitrella brassicaformis CCMP3155]|eukprot:CEM28626.1 unnamed protein product [Vitrella brassicaformis CCMP3155]
MAATELYLMRPTLGSTSLLLGLLVVAALTTVSVGHEGDHGEEQTKGKEDDGGISHSAMGHTRAELTKAVDLNPDKHIYEVNLTASVIEWDYGTDSNITAWAYNGQVPGPLLEASLGDRVIVHFHNGLPEPSMIHWHGLEVPANMDGSQRAQKEVPPGGYFRYDFTLTPSIYHSSSGLLAFYHSHFNTHQQIEKGLHGAFIVRDPQEEALLGLDSQQYDEQVLVLDDILLNETSGRLHSFTPYTDDPHKTLEELHNGREGNFLLVNGRSAKSGLGRMVKKGRVQRLRILNAANARFMRLSLEGGGSGGGGQLWQVGSDGGLMEAPIHIMRDEDMHMDMDTREWTHHGPILLTPGERVDLLWNPPAECDTDCPRLVWHDMTRGRIKAALSINGTEHDNDQEHGHDDGKMAHSHRRLNLLRGGTSRLLQEDDEEDEQDCMMDGMSDGERDDEMAGAASDHVHHGGMGRGRGLHMGHMGQMGMGGGGHMGHMGGMGGHHDEDDEAEGTDDHIHHHGGMGGMGLGHMGRRGGHGGHMGGGGGMGGHGPGHGHDGSTGDDEDDGGHHMGPGMGGGKGCKCPHCRHGPSHDHGGSPHGGHGGHGGHGMAPDPHDGHKADESLMTFHVEDGGTGKSSRLLAAGRKAFSPPARLVEIPQLEMDTDTPMLHVEYGHSMPEGETGQLSFWMMSSAEGEPLPNMMLTARQAPHFYVNDTVMIHVNNPMMAWHNFHIHGFKFQVIEVAQSNSSHGHAHTHATADNHTHTPVMHHMPPPSEQPRHWKDTVAVPPSSSVKALVHFTDEGRAGKVSAFGAKSEGERSGGWLFHCHMLEHAAAGMSAFFQLTERDNGDGEEGGEGKGADDGGHPHDMMGGMDHDGHPGGHHHHMDMGL